MGLLDRYRPTVADQWKPSSYGACVCTDHVDTLLDARIPVADGARILYHHCVAADQPLQTLSATVQELADLGDREDTVLVGLDDQGRLTTADNIAGCPG